MPERTVEIISKVNPETYEPLLGDCTLHVGEHKLEFRRGRAMAPVSVAQLLVDTRSDLQIPELGYNGGVVTARTATAAATAEDPDAITAEGPPPGISEDELAQAATALSQATPSDLRGLIALGKRAEEEVEERRRQDQEQAGNRHVPGRPDTDGIDTAEASRAAAGPLADPDGTVRSEPAADAGTQPTPIQTPEAERPAEQVEAEPESEPTGGPEQTAEEPLSPQVAAAMEHLAGEDLEDAKVEQVEPEVAKDDGQEPEQPAPTPDAPATRIVPPGFDAETAEGEPRCLATTQSNKQCHNAADGGGSACKLAAHKQQFEPDAVKPTA